MLSLLSGHRPRRYYSEERVPVNIAPEVRERLNGLLCSPAFMGTGVGYSAFIDRACEAAETEYAEARTDKRVTDVRELSSGDGRQWCPVCKGYHWHVGVKTDTGVVTRACPLNT